MKNYTFVVILLCSISCNGQKPINVIELEDHLNSNFLVINYQNKEFNSVLEVNLQDSVITYQTPMGSFVGEKYSKSRNQIRLLPIKNIHPEGIFYYDEDKLIKVYSRNNKPGFFNNINSGKKLRWRNEEHDTEFCAFIMNKNYSKEDFEKLKSIFNSVIQSLNKKISSTEKPPIEGLSKPEYKNYRNRTLNLKSKLEETELVLPTQTVDVKPTIENKSFHNSRKSFENQMSKLLKKNKTELKGNLRGFILIDINGDIIEILQEESNSTYTAKNKMFEENALVFKGWKSAEFNGNPVICKIKYFIQKDDWD